MHHFKNWRTNLCDWKANDMPDAQVPGVHIHGGEGMCVHTSERVRVYIYIYIHTYIHACIHTYIFVHVRMCMHAAHELDLMYACMCAYAYMLADVCNVYATYIANVVYVRACV